jgi:cytochrome c2
MHVADATAGAIAFGQCGAIHTIRRDAGDRSGPNLFAVMGAPIGSSKRFGYTAALRNVGGNWTPERMDAWLANPQCFAPGTSMRFLACPIRSNAPTPSLILRDSGDMIGGNALVGPPGLEPGTSRLKVACSTN